MLARQKLAEERLAYETLSLEGLSLYSPKPVIRTRKPRIEQSIRACPRATQETHPKTTNIHITNTPTPTVHPQVTNPINRAFLEQTPGTAFPLDYRPGGVGHAHAHQRPPCQPLINRYAQPLRPPQSPEKPQYRTRLEAWMAS